MKHLWYGFTEVEINKKRVLVYHNGNMGNTVDRSVKPNFDALFGEGLFAKLYPFKTDEVGAPDYSYMVSFKRSDFDKFCMKELTLSLG